MITVALWVWAIGVAIIWIGAFLIAIKDGIADTWLGNVATLICIFAVAFVWPPVLVALGLGYLDERLYRRARSQEDTVRDVLES